MTVSEILENEDLRRHEFPVTREKILLEHAEGCLLPRKVAEAVASCALQIRVTLLWAFFFGL